MIQARLIGGFPWNFLGASQSKLIPLIQTASITGIYGVSFLVAWFSVSLLSGVVSVLREPDRRSAMAREVWVPTLVVAACFAVGFTRINRAPIPSREVRVTVVQPSIPQTDIWDAEVNERRFEELLNLTESALEREADLVVWPEAAVPELLRWDENTYNPILELSMSNDVPMIIGADDAIPYFGPPPERPTEYSNCAWLITPDGEISKPYRKRKLVAFGEHIPFSRVLPFIAWFTPIEGQFTPGTNIVWFDLPELHLRTATLICFEDTFPHEARKHVDAETDFLVNLTNDGWFGQSAAQWQQAATAVFRAVENGVPLLRATNNGITCWIDRFGRMRQVFRDSEGSVYGRGFARFMLQLSAKGDHAETLYNRYGDWFGWGCVGLGFVSLAWGIVGSRNKPTTEANDVSAQPTSDERSA
jgi:apolipoprotein N-acyltransferase